ncbi:MAG TPA: GYD domain-containing protein [Pseudolabrys sp.]|nr:GYD domain-containing protein [Pseudolabrys sp.]
MPSFMLSLNYTDQGIRSIKDSPKRAEAARELARKCGAEIRHLYLTTGDSDLVVFVDAPDGENIAKFALALGAQGNVRSRTARIWPHEEFRKIVSELP